MQKTRSNNKNSKSIIGLLKYIFGLILQFIKKNKEEDKIQNNLEEMNEEWNNIDEEQNEEFAYIDSMSLEDLKNQIDKK